MDRMNIPKNIMIIADSARPEMIADIHAAGYSIIPVKKYKGSVNDQIDFVATHNIHINGHNLLHEISEYVWKLDKSGKPMDIPVDGADHTLDAARY